MLDAGPCAGRRLCIRAVLSCRFSVLRTEVVGRWRSCSRELATTSSRGKGRRGRLCSRGSGKLLQRR